MAVKAIALFVAVGGIAFAADAARAQGVPDPGTATSAIPAPPPVAPVEEAVASAAPAAAPVAQVAAPDVQVAVPDVQAAAPVTDAVAPVAEAASRVVREAALAAAPARRSPPKISAPAPDTKPKPEVRPVSVPPKVAHQAEQVTATSAPARAERAAAPVHEVSSGDTSPVAAPAAPAVVATAEKATDARRHARRPARPRAGTHARPVPAHVATAVSRATTTTPPLAPHIGWSRPQPAAPSGAPAIPRPGGPVDDDDAAAVSLLAGAAAAGLNLSFLAALLAAIALAVPRSGRRLRLGMASRPPPRLAFALERPG